MRNKLLIVLPIALLIGITLYLIRNETVDIDSLQSSSQDTVFNNPANDSTQSNEPITVIADNLNIPWELVFLSDGDLLITERVGNVIRINQETRTSQRIDGVAHIGEGGLLGMVLHPDFENNRYIYLYLTVRTETGLENRVERYVLTDNRLTDREVILDGIAGASNHDGGKMAFAPDGYLYITTGDAGSQNLAQDLSSLNGKILRIADDGSIPEDNPFNNAIYSYGHRNPQGLTWDENGNLWETEHGPSGSQSGFDELNLITKGGNYGWPIIRGDQTREGMIPPVIHSGASDTWAPGSTVYFNGSIYFTGLRGTALYEARIQNNNVSEFTVHLDNTFGRLRGLKIGPNNQFYLTTSNRDGRGQARDNDDKLIKVNPNNL